MTKYIDYVSALTTLEKRHDDCVTDLEFSPMNKVLAASCSLDGTIVFHDIHSQKKIQTLRPILTTGANGGRSAGERIGLTSLAFHSNGYTWAVGTNNGYVMNYDLRQISSGPLSTINVGDLGEVTGGDEMATADNRSGISKRISYPVNRLQFSPIQPSSKTPKTTKKKSLVSSSAIMTATSVQTKQQTVHVEEEDAAKFSSSKKEARKEMKQLNSPQLSSPTIPKELFQMDDVRDESIKSDTVVETNIDKKMPEYSRNIGNLSIEKNPILEKQSQIQEHTRSISTQDYSISKSESMEGGPPSDANGMLQSFDQMYKRLQNRETLYSSLQTELNDSMRKSNDDNSQILMITKVNHMCSMMNIIY